MIEVLLTGKVTSLVTKKDQILATRIEEAIQKNESLETLNAESVRKEAADILRPNRPKTSESVISSKSATRTGRSSAMADRNPRTRRSPAASKPGKFTSSEDQNTRKSPVAQRNTHRSPAASRPGKFTSSEGQNPRKSPVALRNTKRSPAASKPGKFTSSEGQNPRKSPVALRNTKRSPAVAKSGKFENPRRSSEVAKPGKIVAGSDRKPRRSPEAAKSGKFVAVKEWKPKKAATSEGKRKVKAAIAPRAGKISVVGFRRSSAARAN